MACFKYYIIFLQHNNNHIILINTYFLLAQNQINNNNLQPPIPILFVADLRNSSKIKYKSDLLDTNDIDVFGYLTLKIPSSNIFIYAKIIIFFRYEDFFVFLIKFILY